jgi:hypothetical protein
VRLGSCRSAVGATVAEDELEYLTERALHELRAAMMSFEARVRSVHIQMLDAYTLRLQELKSTWPADQGS